jgi:hypothetical protein
MPRTSIFQNSIFWAPTRLEPTTHRVVCRYWSSAPHADLRMVRSHIITNGQPSADIKWSFKVRTGATRPQTILKCRLLSSLDYRTRHGSQSRSSNLFWILPQWSLKSRQSLKGIKLWGCLNVLTELEVQCMYNLVHKISACLLSPASA